MYENFKHNDPDEFHGKELILHDCIADKISYEDGILRFRLSDGFWVTPHHNENHSNKTIRTDAAVVAFSAEDIGDIVVRVFSQNIFKKTCVDIWDMSELISVINNRKCKIEFITQYKTHFEQLWHCVIHSNKKPYYRECQLHLPNTKATYYWNNLCFDREW